MSASDQGPKHYKSMSIEPWDVIDLWPVEQRIGFYRGNLLKYTMRLGSKDEAISEAKKAQHYAAKLVETLEQANTDRLVKNLQGNNLSIHMDDLRWSEHHEARMDVIGQNGPDGLIYSFKFGSDSDGEAL